jgi:hypothetical protein
MNEEYTIKSEQTLTKGGVLGVWLFIGGPILFALGLALLSAEQRSYNPNVGYTFVMMGLGSFGFLISCVLLLVGRGQKHVVTVYRPKQ